MIKNESKKRKLLFILNTDKFLLSHRIEIANELIKNNYEVHLGSAQTEYSKEINNLGIKTHNISINRTSLGLINGVRTAQLAKTKTQSLGLVSSSYFLFLFHDSKLNITIVLF